MWLLVTAADSAPSSRRDSAIADASGLELVDKSALHWAAGAPTVTEQQVEFGQCASGDRASLMASMFTEVL